MKKLVSVYLDESLCDLIAVLAKEQRRSRSNFIEQFLSVSLTADMDRDALFKVMNPALTSMLPAIRKERDRLGSLMQEPT